MANSQNPYPTAFDPNAGNTIVTPNAFWAGAGGTAQEQMLLSGDMTIYRTIHRIKEDSKAHGPSVEQNLLGNLNVECPGIATTLAWIVSQNNPFDKDVAELLLPFVTLEGASLVFRNGQLTLAPNLKALSLSSDLENPYQRSRISGAGYLEQGGQVDRLLAALARTTNGQSSFTRLTEAFSLQDDLAAQMQSLLDPEVIDMLITDYNSRLPADGQINYGNGTFGRRLKAAVSLALANRETLFISVGSPGLGGWDDHSDALEEFPERMEELMHAIHAAVTHMNAAKNDTVAPVDFADRIIINMYTDFGRNVNLNNSMGWDHGNNQNLYTFGGRGVPGRNLGKIVGSTRRIGNSRVNRQFTAPAEGSYEAEPFAIASSIYSYFGVENPAVLTGEPALDENVASESIVAGTPG